MPFTYRENSFRDKLQQYIADDNSLRNEASFLPMSYTTLWRVAHGKKSPTMREFMAICNRMKIDPIQFFDEDDYQMEMF